jgi:hypothetical protein
LALDFGLSESPFGPAYILLAGKFTSGIAAFEPAPLGLMAIGLAGLLGLVFKGRKRMALSKTRVAITHS